MRPSALSFLIRGVVILVFVGLGFLSPSPVQAQQTCLEVGGDCRPVTQDGICFAGEVIDNSGSCEGAGVKCCAAPSCGDRGGACQPAATACATGTTALGNASCSSGLCCTQPTDGPTCGELLGHGNGQCVQYSDACPAGYTNAGPTRECLSCCNPGGSAPPLPGPGGAGYKVEFIHTDALGSVRLVTDQSGGVVSRHDYRPFGEEIGPGTHGRGTIGGYVPSAEDPWRLRERFTGKERDGESGLDYFGARYYSGAQGRFTSVDPGNAGASVENPQSWNGYSYALNSPTKYVDSDGKAAIIPVLFAAYVVYDTLSAVYDGYNAVQTVSDPNATNRDKGMAVGAAAISMLPGIPGGAAKIIKEGAERLTKEGVEQLAKHGDEVAKGAMWTSTKAKSSVENAFGHFKEHGADFGAANSVDYVRKAQDFLQNPGVGALSKVRKNGDVVLYNPATNTFAVMDKTGAPRTFYKPDPAKHKYATNLDYFNAQ